MDNENVQINVFRSKNLRIFPNSFEDSKTIVTASTSSIKSLSVDWISGNLFWTDSANGKIKVSNLDGSLVADLISYGLKKPRDIVVDPIKGYVYPSAVLW